MKLVFDAIIVGGGPAGAVTALQLARAGRDVLLVDREPKDQRKIGESLPSSSRPLLKHLGLLKLVEEGPHLVSYGNISAWGSEDIQHNDFIMDPSGTGWHLDRARFDADLRTAARQAGTNFLSGLVDSIAATDFGWRVQCEGHTIESRWIVDATGRVASIARQLGAVRKKDDNLMAIYAFAQPKRGDLDTRTLVESSEHGWWYTAQLPDSTRVVAFHSDSATVGEIIRSPFGWQKHLGETIHIRNILRSAPLITDLKCTEATGARLDKFAGRNWLATGDAALSFDPLSSQGIFNSLYTGMKAAEAVRQALMGDVVGVAEYVHGLEKIRAAYVSHRRLYYSIEQRWADEKFWKEKTLALARS